MNLKQSEELKQSMLLLIYTNIKTFCINYKTDILSKIKVFKSDLINRHFFSKYSKKIIKFLLFIFVVFIFFHINQWLELLFELIKYDVNKSNSLIVDTRIADIALTLSVLLFILLFLFYRLRDNRLWSKTKLFFIFFSLYPLLPSTWQYIHSAWLPWFNYVKFFFYAILIVENLHFIKFSYFHLVDSSYKCNFSVIV